MLLPYLLRAAGWQAGTFVEIGALDGVQFSNTFILERCFNWTGLLVEGNPRNFRELNASSRRAHKVHSAVCNRTLGHVHMTARGGSVSAQLETMSETHRQRYGWSRRQWHSVAVPCSPLASLMANAAGMYGAHFLSVDVEGAEDIVLQTVDAACFAVILVELDGSNPTKDARVRTILTDAGLEFQRRLALKGSEVYLRPQRAVQRIRRQRGWRNRCGGAFYAAAHRPNENARPM